jgi:predicted Holliday junction resolvase-like endonuclease
MDPLTPLMALLLLLLLAAWWLHSRSLKRRLRALDSMKRSQSTRYGQITEQFAPFLSNWPWDSKGFRFIGNPIDGIQFTQDEVVFVEVKSARSQLSPAQRRIRELVEAGRVRWSEVRIE